MSGRELYLTHYEAARIFGYPAPAWYDLSPTTKAEWEMKAIEQTERDLEREHEALATLDNREDR